MPLKYRLALNAGLALTALSGAAFATVLPWQNDILDAAYEGNSVAVVEQHALVGTIFDDFEDDEMHRLFGDQIYVPWAYRVEVTTQYGEQIIFWDFMRNGTYNMTDASSDPFYILRDGESTEIVDSAYRPVMTYSPDTLDGLLDSAGCKVPSQSFLDQVYLATECED